MSIQIRYGAHSNYNCHVVHKMLLETQVKGRLFYSTSKNRTTGNPPLGMQTIPTIYFKHFHVLSIPLIMSEILRKVDLPLSQITPCFLPYQKGFINICLALNVLPKMSVFLQFMTFKHSSGDTNKVICV